VRWILQLLNISRKLIIIENSGKVYPYHSDIVYMLNRKN
jgi:hypothetical protein